MPSCPILRQEEKDACENGMPTQKPSSRLYLLALWGMLDTTGGCYICFPLEV